jgi:hypothetical protein
MGANEDIEVMIDNGMRDILETGSFTGYQSYLLRCNVFHHEINRLNAQLPLPGGTDPTDLATYGLPNTLIVDWLQVTEAIIVTGVIYYTSPGTGEPSVNDLETAVRTWWVGFVTAGMLPERLCTLTEKRVDGYIAYRGLFDSLTLERESGRDEYCKFTLVFLSAFKEDLGTFMPPFSGMLMYYENEADYKGNAAHDMTVTTPGVDLPGKWIQEVNKRSLRLTDSMAGRVRVVELVVGNPKELVSIKYSDTFPMRICLVDPRTRHVMFLGRLDSKETYPAGDEGQYVKLVVYDLMKILQNSGGGHDYRVYATATGTPTLPAMGDSTYVYPPIPGLVTESVKYGRSDLIQLMILGSAKDAVLFSQGGFGYNVSTYAKTPSADKFADLAFYVPNRSVQPFPINDGLYGNDYSGSSDSVFQIATKLAAEDPWIFTWTGTAYYMVPDTLLSFNAWLDEHPMYRTTSYGWAGILYNKYKLDEAKSFTQQTAPAPNSGVGSGYDFFVEDGVVPGAWLPDEVLPPGVYGPPVPGVLRVRHAQATFRYFKRGSLESNVEFHPNESDLHHMPMQIQYDASTAKFCKYQGERLTKVTVHTSDPLWDVTDSSGKDGADEATDPTLEETLQAVREKVVYDPAINNKNDAILRRDAEFKASESLWTAEITVAGYPQCKSPVSNGSIIWYENKPLRAAMKVKVFFPDPTGAMASTASPDGTVLSVKGSMEGVVVSIDYQEPPAMSVITIMEHLPTGGGYGFARDIVAKLGAVTEQMIQSETTTVAGR